VQLSRKKWKKMIKRIQGFRESRVQGKSKGES
jgi:hypothetical protein